jgi:1-deoxy-D-xylulose-5-phosphate reductoisomerase
MKRIAVLGSTGSIGTMTLDIISHLKYKAVVLSTNGNVELLMEQIKIYRPEYAVIYDKKIGEKFLQNEKNFLKKYKTKIYLGIEGLIEAASLKNLDIVVVSVVGAVGLLPVISGIRAGHTIAIANKEPLVIAGKLLMQEAKKYNAKILPIDSEHSAIFQCLRGENSKEVNKILLTASGGPFFKYNQKQLQKVNIEHALKHPRWKMGKKITVDSATLMNKGLEVIEAHHLFNMPFEKIEVLVHPESIIHSMVEFYDGSIIANIGPTDMRIPIQFALTYPDRKISNVEKLNFNNIKSLNFSSINMKQFPCLEMALNAGKIGESMPVVLNAANEVAVESFLRGEIHFCDIPKIIRKVLDKHKLIKMNSLEDIIMLDSITRKITDYMTARF